MVNQAGSKPDKLFFTYLCPCPLAFSLRLHCQYLFRTHSEVFFPVPPFIALIFISDISDINDNSHSIFSLFPSTRISLTSMINLMYFLPNCLARQIKKVIEAIQYQQSLEWDQRRKTVLVQSAGIQITRATEMNGNMMLLTNKHSIPACKINYPAIQALIINDVLHICHFFPSATEETPFASHSRIGVQLYPRKINHQPIFTRYHRTSPRICGSDTTPLCSSRAVRVNLDPWKVVSGENFVFAGQNEPGEAQLWRAVVVVSEGWYYQYDIYSS